MTRAAIQGLWSRKLRTSLTALAVVFGVAMVSGTFVLTDTVSKAFDSLFQRSYSNSSAVISGKEVVQGSPSGNATVPQSLLNRVKQVPEVGSAAGAIFNLTGTTDTAKLLDKHGKQITSAGGSPNFGWGLDASQPKLNPLTLKKGAWATTPTQVVIDTDTADKKGFDVGDRIGVAALGPKRYFTITGLAQLGDVKSIGGATFAVFTVPTAQALLGKKGRLDTIFLGAKSGTSDEQLAAKVRPLLPPSAQVQTAAQRADADSQDTKDGMNFVRYALLAFAAIALLVGSFVIFNTLSMTLAQRVRELATLRTLGASRKQVRRSVLLEGLVTGLVASVVGLVLGIALAKGLAKLFDALGLGLPEQGTVIAGRTIIVSLLVGTIVTVLATVSPARRATRVPPIAAVREGATLPPSRMMLKGGRNATLGLGLAVALLAVGLLVGGLSTGAVLLTVGVGCLALFFGVGLVASRTVRPLVAVVGAPSERFGGPAGRLARENSTRNPARTARTAGALMIGLALIAFVATLAQGLRHTVKSAANRQVSADYVVTSKNGFDPFPAGAGKAVARAPKVTATTDVRGDKVRAFGKDVSVDGVDPTTIARFYNFRWKQGSDASLGALGVAGAIITKKFADDHNLRVGSPIAVTAPSGGKAVLRVVGVHDPPSGQLDSVLAPLAVSQRVFDAAFPRAKNQFTFVDVAGGANSQTTDALKASVSAFPDAKVATKASWVTTRSNGINKLLNIFYVLLGLSVLISLFGMVNALVLAVFERTRELGMLRAIGLTRTQTRRMVRHESVITALIGACLGLPLGIALAAIVTRALRSADVSFALPVVAIVELAAVAVIAGIVAAALPARRASRLNVLEALHYE